MGALGSTVGRKLVAAATGLALAAFLLGHAAGVATLWAGGLNAYAARLHALPALFWVARLVLVALLGLHVWQGVTLTLENRAAAGGAYAVRSYRSSTLASRTMIWSGLAIAGFLAYHLLHFTLRVIGPPPVAAAAPPGVDVERMVVAGLGDPARAAVYAAGLAALGLHLFHGLASAMQTMGLNGARSFPWLRRGATALAVALAAAFVAVVAGVLAGVVR